MPRPGICALRIAALVATFILATPVEAQEREFLRLERLDQDEAEMVVGKLARQQDWLAQGRESGVEILAGGAAATPEADMSARAALLALPIDQTLFVRKLEPDSALWQRYRLSIAPDGLGHPYWEVEVVLGSSGDVARITMLHRAPAPF